MKGQEVARGLIKRFSARPHAGLLRRRFGGRNRSIKKRMARQLQAIKMELRKTNARPHRRRLRAGEALDIVVAPSPAIEGLLAPGLLLPDSRVEVARSGIGVRRQRPNDARRD